MENSLKALLNYIVLACRRATGILDHTRDLDTFWKEVLVIQEFLQAVQRLVKPLVSSGEERETIPLRASPTIPLRHSPSRDETSKPIRYPYFLDEAPPVRYCIPGDPWSVDPNHIPLTPHLGILKGERSMLDEEWQSGSYYPPSDIRESDDGAAGEPLFGCDVPLPESLDEIQEHYPEVYERALSRRELEYAHDYEELTEQPYPVLPILERIYRGRDRAVPKPVYVPPAGSPLSFTRLDERFVAHREASPDKMARLALQKHLIQVNNVRHRTAKLYERFREWGILRFGIRDTTQQLAEMNLYPTGDSRSGFLKVKDATTGWIYGPFWSGLEFYSVMQKIKMDRIKYRKESEHDQLA